MKFIIPTIGTRGDVQPYIALSLGLMRHGNQVTLVSHPCMRNLVESYEVPFAPMGPDIDIGYEAAKIRGRSKNWMLGFKRVMDFSFSMLEQSYSDLLPLCRQADAVIVSHSAAGSMEADTLDLPRVSVTLMPQAIPVNDPNASWINRAVMKAAGTAMGMMMTRPLENIRRRKGLPPMGPYGITSQVLNLVPISPLIEKPNPLWEPRHKMTGYWFAPQPKTFNPPASLVQFLEAGEPPLVISLGAMSLSGDDTLEAARVTLEALNQTGTRAIIQGWDGALQTLPIPPTIISAGSIPHNWLLPKAAGLIHHGGFGTTAAGFQAGIPSIVIPHIIDQYIWGNKVMELGVGSKPIPRARLTISTLAAGIETIKDKRIKEKAAILGEQIRNEPDGVETAVQWIEQTFEIRS
ncbi:glycosyl transferase family 1 [Leptolinea sp. HRD-7]|nr:glycosyl transferase family 1 [Leptolinea sp. HRD-7]